MVTEFVAKVHNLVIFVWQLCNVCLGEITFAFNVMQFIAVSFLCYSIIYNQLKEHYNLTNSTTLLNNL